MDQLRDNREVTDLESMVTVSLASTLSGSACKIDSSPDLIAASHIGAIDIASALINAKADVEVSLDGNIQHTPLYIAVVSGHAAFITLLLDSGARIHPLHVIAAAERGNHHILRTLIDVVTRTYDIGILHFIASATLSDSIPSEAALDTIIASAPPSQLNSNDKAGFTPLILAIKHANYALIPLLIACGASALMADSRGTPSLIHAAEAHHIDTLHCLINAKADVNATESSGLTALAVAARSGWAEAVEALLDAEADAALTCVDGNTPLIYAVLHNHVEAVKLLLEPPFVSVVEWRNIDGMTALHIAVENGHVDMAEMLLRSGADVDGSDTQGLSVLMSARTVDIATVLLYNNVAIDAADHNGRTALMHACIIGDAPMVSLLIDWAANVNTNDAEQRTALFYAVKAQCDDTGLVQALLEAEPRADANAQDCLGDTPLMVAVEAGRPDTVMILLDAGACPRKSNLLGQTALMRAVESDSVRLLLEADRDCAADRDKKEKTTLMHMACNNSVEAIRTVLSINGCDAVHDSDEHGDTALFSAMTMGNSEVVDLLIDSKADPFIVKNDGATALMATVAPTWVDHGINDVSDMDNRLASCICTFIDRAQGRDIRAVE
jgi:ankyrin repeat protein